MNPIRLIGLLSASVLIANTERLTILERAQKGDAECQCIVGAAMEDKVQGLVWLRKSAAQNFAPAQAILGRCYYVGEGVERNRFAAESWYRKAAEQGDADGQYGLGFLYQRGDILKKDDTTAFEWYRKSASQGHRYGQLALGNCYFYGEGIPKDFTEAVKWYRKAASRGLKEAQFKLGTCYAEGKGVPKDLIESYAYLNLAGATLEEARSNLDVLEKELSQEKIAAGQIRTKKLLEEFDAEIRTGK
jgi:hypothetical protein